MTKEEIIMQQFFEIVENQLKLNAPPETKLTFERLKKKGVDEKKAKMMIATCVSDEMIAILESGMPFNEKRYVKCLGKL